MILSPFHGDLEHPDWGDLPPLLLLHHAWQATTRGLKNSTNSEAVYIVICRYIIIIYMCLVGGL